jgi:hypothetical protein
MPNRRLELWLTWYRLCYEFRYVLGIYRKTGTPAEQGSSGKVAESTTSANAKYRYIQQVPKVSRKKFKRESHHDPAAAADGQTPATTLLEHGQLGIGSGLRGKQKQPDPEPPRLTTLHTKQTSADYAYSQPAKAPTGARGEAHE